MPQTSKTTKIAYEVAVTSLSEENRAIVQLLHERAVTIGYVPSVTIAGKKLDSYNVEYSKPKAKGSLFIARIDGDHLLLRCKLFHLNEYCSIITELSEGVSRSLLSSHGCGGHSGCKGPVSLDWDGVAYSFCRHAIEFTPSTTDDIEGVWKLLAAEDDSRRLNG